MHRGYRSGPAIAGVRTRTHESCPPGTFTAVRGLTRMTIRMHRLAARIKTGIALLMLPLLVLMPLLHGHPLGTVGSDHPVGWHLPSAVGPAGVSPAPTAGGTPSLATGRAAEGGVPATIVVQEPRTRGTGRGLSLPQAASTEVLRRPVHVAVSRVRTGRLAAPGERPQPWVEEQRPQAPPLRAAAAAA